MKYLFLDTVTLLHYKLFEDIPWKQMICFDGNFTVVICETVLAEIDKHKDNQRGKIRNRAKKISGMLGDIFLKDQKRKVHVEYCPFIPPSNRQKEQFDLSVCDNRILLSALNSKYPNSDIYIVSSDNNLLIKSKANGLSVYKMGEEYLISEEPTEEEKKIKELSSKLSIYENRMPEPFIAFENGKDLLKIRVPIRCSVDEEIAQYMDELKSKYPERKLPPFNKNNMLSLLSHYTETPDAINGYNEMRIQFFKDSEKLKTLELLQSWHDKIMVPLNFFIMNKGNAQTGNSNIFIEFPEDLVVYDENKSTKIYSCQCPKEPSVDITKIMMSKMYPPSYRNIKLWDTQKSFKAKTLKFCLHHINHQIMTQLNEGVIINASKTKSFEIKWTIIDSVLPEPKCGVLKVEITKE